MERRAYGACTVVLALTFPVAALADTSGSVTIPTNMHFSFDTGVVSSSGGDIQFTGASVIYAGTATGINQGNSILEYWSFNLYEMTSVYSDGVLNTKRILALAPNDFFLIHTSGGNFAKAMMISVSGSALQIQWYTFGASATGGTPLPTISAVENAGNYQFAGDIAPGSIFVIPGTNLSGSGYVQTSFPLPTSSNGVTITFWPPSPDSFVESGINVYLVSLYNQSGVNQLAGIVPSTLSPGMYQVTVTYNGVSSAPVEVTVATAQPGLITQDSSGNGLVLVQNYVSASELDINRFTTGIVSGSRISPARPGQTLIAWLTGLGAISGPDNIGTQAYNFLANGASVQIYVGGMAITPFYAGRAPGLAGLDQIDFTLPADVPTGCTVGFQISENGVLSQPTFISIAPSTGATECVQTGISATELQALDNGATLAVGEIYVNQGFASANFIAFTGFELTGAVYPFSPLGSGCGVYQYNSAPFPPGTRDPGRGVELDAGALTLNGPSGSGLSSVTLPETNRSYSLNFSGQGTSISGEFLAGTYTVTGLGGQDVGPFRATVAIPPLLSVSNLPSVINRSSDLTLNWTGGNPSDQVIVAGFAYNTANNLSIGTSFTCYTTAGTGTLTVPASILNQLPAVTAAAIANNTGYGQVSVSWTMTPSASNGEFSAPLTGGGTTGIATFIGSGGSSAKVVFQ